MIIKNVDRAAGTRDRLVGLLEYLAGPGRAEEHENQRVVAGWSPEIDELDLQDRDDRIELAQLMEAPARLWHTDPPKDGFVYHVPISLHAEDGGLSDAQWGYVARKVVAKLGMDECRWVAVHHGMARSAEGPRDHIHLVVHRAREDGTVASTWRDWVKLAEVRAELEDDPTLGLTVKTRRQCGGRGGWKQGERRGAARSGRHLPDREQLERAVRGAAAAASSEGEWVLALRRSGALVRPRYATGGQGEVVGYSVAMPPKDGHAPVWFGGGKLSKDLALPALRRRWEGQDPADAVSAWSKKAGARVRQAREGESVWPQAHEAWERFDHAVASTSPDDERAWRAFARETSEALSALLPRVPASERTAVHQAAVRMARVAEVPTARERGVPSRGADAVRSACQVITNAHIAGRGGWMSVAALTVQMARTVDVIRRANAAMADAASARHAALVATDLNGLGTRLADPRRANAALQQAAMPTRPRITPGRSGSRRSANPMPPVRPRHRDTGPEHGRD